DHGGGTPHQERSDEGEQNGAGRSDRMVEYGIKDRGKEEKPDAHPDVPIYGVSHGLDLGERNLPHGGLGPSLLHRNRLRTPNRAEASVYLSRSIHFIRLSLVK